MHTFVKGVVITLRVLSCVIIIMALGCIIETVIHPEIFSGIDTAILFILGAIIFWMLSSMIND